MSGPSTGAGGPVRLLWLLRHATAVADPTSEGSDHDRPLTPGGRRDAEALGSRLGADRFGLAPEELPGVVLCSTARRALQTAEGALHGIAAHVDLRHSLYRASPEELLAEVRTSDDDARSVMAVGHNPTVHRLAVAMIDDADEVGRRSLEGKFPACGLAVFRLTARRWRDVAEGTGSLAGWFVPPFG